MPATRNIVSAALILISVIPAFGQSTSGESTTRGFVLAIGSNRFGKLDGIKYAEKDAQAIAGKFGQLGYQQRLLIGSTASVEVLQRTLADVVPKVGPKQVLIVYFAGYAQYDKNQNELSLGLPQVAGDSKEEALSVTHLDGMLRDGAGTVLVILDGPPDEAAIKATWRPPTDTKVGFWIGRGLELVQAEHGAFTAAILSTLEFRSRYGLSMDLAHIVQQADAHFSQHSISYSLPEGVAFGGASRPKVSRLALLLAPEAGWSAVSPKLIGELTSGLKATGLDAQTIVQLPEDLSLEDIPEVVDMAAPVSDVLLLVAFRTSGSGSLSQQARGVRQFRVDPIQALLGSLLEKGNRVFMVVDQGIIDQGSKWEFGPDKPLAMLIGNSSNAATGPESAEPSIFMKHFLEVLLAPGLTVRALAEEVQRRTLDDPKRPEGQVPLFLSPAGDLFLVNPAKAGH